MYFQLCMDCIDIAGCSSARGLQSEYSRRKFWFSTSMRNNVLQTVSNTDTVTINHHQEITYRWFAIDFFARDLHTRTAFVHLPLHHLGFLVILYCSISISSCVVFAVHLAFLPEPVYRGPELITYFRGPNLEVTFCSALCNVFTSKLCYHKDDLAMSVI